MYLEAPALEEFEDLLLFSIKRNQIATVCQQQEKPFVLGALATLSHFFLILPFQQLPIKASKRYQVNSKSYQHHLQAQLLQKRVSCKDCSIKLTAFTSSTLSTTMPCSHCKSLAEALQLPSLLLLLPFFLSHVSKPRREIAGCKKEKIQPAVPSSVKRWQWKGCQPQMVWEEKQTSLQNTKWAVSVLW